MASVSEVIDRVRSFGANITLDGNKLVIVNREKLPTGALDYIKAHGRLIADFLDKEGDFSERAAILEYDGGLTRSIAEYLTKLLLSNPPEGASPADWSWFVAEGAKIAERGLAA